MRAKKSFLRILIIVLSGLGFAGIGGAEDIPKLCPLNPAFTDYINVQRSMVSSDSEGHFFGYIPSPILPEIHTSGELEAGFAHDPMYDMRDPDGDGNQADSLLTPVKAQGECGSCWAFATYGSLESQIKEFLIVDEDFSEDNLKHRHGFDWGPCEGGNIKMSSAYLSRYDGPISESDDPYDESQYSEYCIDCSPVRYIDNVVFLPVRSNVNDNTYIKQAILDHGGLYTSLFYQSSSYNPGDYTYYYNGSGLSNHAVVIVGWDDSKVITGAPDNGAFIVRNSWGDGWGDGGYFYVSYYDTEIVFSSLAYFDEKTESGLDFNKIYYYDKLGWTASLGYGPITWGANWFIPDSDGILTAVGFYATHSNMSYEINIYDEFNGSSFSDLRFSQTGTVMYSGWYTVKLDQEVAINKNDGFGVVIRFNTPGYNFPVPIEMPIAGYSSGATANPGESYISPSGSSWSDITDYPYYANTNICIKAFSKDLDLCEGDFDRDRDVDGSDLAIFAADFGRTDCDTAPFCEGDFDRDNDVDSSGLAIFAADFGRTDCPPCPE